MGADVLGVSVINMLPDVFHVGDFLLVVEVAEEFLLKFVGGGARDDAGDVHIGVAGASETEVNNANHFVVFV